MEHHALEKIDECLAMFCREDPRMTGGGPERGLVQREGKGLELYGVAFGIGAYDQKVPEIRDQNLTVSLPILRNLFTVSF
jgi:hypothetical protein